MAKLIPYLLEKGEIKLPAVIFKNEILEEFERKLLSGSPAAVSVFFRKLSENVEDIVNSEKIRKSLEVVAKYRENLNEKAKLSEDDERILRFLVGKELFALEDFLEILGPIYQILVVAEDLEKEKIKSEIVRMFIATSSYVQLYELTLYNVDRRIYRYLAKKKEKQLSKIEKNFLKVDRSYAQHATAGLINKVLSYILGISEKNESIFSSSKTRILRNKISHANLFYDPESRKIIAGKDVLEVEDFLAEYYRLLHFNIRWLELSANVEIENWFDVLVDKIKNTLSGISKAFLMIERSSEYKRQYGNLVILWRKDLQS